EKARVPEGVEVGVRERAPSLAIAALAGELRRQHADVLDDRVGIHPGSLVQESADGAVESTTRRARGVLANSARAYGYDQGRIDNVHRDAVACRSFPHRIE